MKAAPSPPSGQTKSDPLWQSSDAVSLYGIDAWGASYLGVSEQGHMLVHPSKESSVKIDLFELVEGLRERQIEPPVLLRFADLL